MLKCNDCGVVLLHDASGVNEGMRRKLVAAHGRSIHDGLRVGYVADEPAMTKAEGRCERRTHVHEKYAILHPTPTSSLQGHPSHKKKRIDPRKYIRGGNMDTAGLLLTLLAS